MPPIGRESDGHVKSDLASIARPPFTPFPAPPAPLPSRHDPALHPRPLPRHHRDAARAALRNTLDLARFADALGYTRYWLAEHHNLATIASSAPDIMIGQVAAITKNLRSARAA